MSQEKKNEEAKMTGFFQSLKSVLLTAKVIFRMDWKNIPAFVGNQIFLTVQPFVALYFSARIPFLGCFLHPDCLFNDIFYSFYCPYSDSVNLF